MSAPIDPPPQLARFPAAVLEAYRRFRTTGDIDAVQTVTEAAVADFLPQHKAALRTQPLDDKARLMEDLGYDSLAIAEVVFFFEDLFKVTITSQEISHVTTVGELRSFVARKVAETRPAS